jgi:hypothetical protein
MTVVRFPHMFYNCSYNSRFSFGSKILRFIRNKFSNHRLDLPKWLFEVFAARFVPDREQLHPDTLLSLHLIAMHKEGNALPQSSMKGGEADAFVDMLLESRHRAQAAIEALEVVTPFLVETLRYHWSTGQGTRLRHVIWSLYTCSHLVNLGDACSGLDTELANAMGAVIAARLALGPEVEDQLRYILDTSGEFARFDEVEKLTPENMAVIYPPNASHHKDLRRLADADEALAGILSERA